MSENNNDTSILMHPIGFVDNSIFEPASAREKKDTESLIVLKSEYAEGLDSITDFDKIQVFFYFHLSEGFSMIQKRRYDGKMAGVFASRSPKRPNGIGVTVVELLKVDTNILHVKGLDAINGTPILDIKPYISE
ncbi:MAG: tRNA (adenine37-N6)-methyltransferase [Methanolobus sp.]|jgi:tRNA-Thr(GGU) m(6)t(6)A37 methyltransferase TsaA|uniref:tRNA (N6-threonylcarbamoyladenosine(37)-N6)-methyltransferase TrmO n=1 Tax=Methanolobus sp. TaxID=1874737 RepID=UPI0024AB7F60|nr:tRNA (N6-threonylcarbamoyladenosine(37)-N6)-methyltransferase TrmO [Methanolobus sp.]MDI3485679.1 tRNA (adenine37-N6)-methyltransferase [Methanolobus sp.]MDK2832485.1 tRNA (adenine37-N6)-methyltransferase [Methanolobus sp.]